MNQSNNAIVTAAYTAVLQNFLAMIMTMIDRRRSVFMARYRGTLAALADLERHGYEWRAMDGRSIIAQLKSLYFKYVQAPKQDRVSALLMVHALATYRFIHAPEDCDGPGNLTDAFNYALHRLQNKNKLTMDLRMNSNMDSANPLLSITFE